MAAVALSLFAVMSGIWFVAKGPGANPDGLPFVDQTTTTSLVESTVPVEESIPATTLRPTTTETSITSTTVDTTTSLPASTTVVTTGPSTSIGDEPVDTIAPSAPTTVAPVVSTTSSTPSSSPPTPPEPDGTTTTTTTTTSEPTTTPAPSPPEGRTLIFAEEFDSLDPDTWLAENSTYGDGNNEMQCYTPQQVSVRNGRLVLRAEARVETCPNGSTRDVVSGMVRSSGFEFAPGQSIEFRVKLTPNDEVNQAGLWPAFWSSSWAGGWPAGGEWDGLEVMTAKDPARSVYSIHYANSAGQHSKKSTEFVGTENFSANWHVVRFDYGTGGVLTWYLDGEVVSVIENADTVQGYPAPFDQPMTELKINLSLGGNPGPLDLRALPATFEVDYIRIYSR